MGLFTRQVHDCSAKPAEMERAPGLAPGKSGFASRRLDCFGIARVNGELKKPLSQSEVSALALMHGVWTTRYLVKVVNS